MSDFVTLLSARNDLDVDYTNSFNVKERLELLKKDRMKGKYSPDYHAKVMQCMVDQMPSKDEDVTLKVEVLLLMIGTLFQTAKQGAVLDRANWLLTGKRILQLLSTVNNPVFSRALRKAHSEEGQVSKEKFDVEAENLFEVERSVFPSLSNFLEHMDEHLWKSFQKLDHTDIQYIQRIQDENALLHLADRVSEFFKTFNQDMYLSRIGIIKLTYLYYKNDTIYERIRERLAAKGKAPQKPSDDLTGTYLPEDSKSTISALFRQI